MAVLTATPVTAKMPMGPHWGQVYSCTPGAGAADEWIVTQMGTVLSAFPVSFSATVDTYNVLANAEGTGAAQTTAGACGIEAVAGSLLTHIFVIGD